MNPWLKKLSDYEGWVAKHPDVVSDIETTSKFASLVFMGRLSNSSVTSELVYTLSNLMVFYHDGILRKHSTQQTKSTKKIQYNKELIISIERTKILLTTLEHCEVFVELFVQRLKGTRAKWITVFMLQLMKTVGRYYLLYHTKDNIVIMPPIQRVNRHNLKKMCTKVESKENADSWSTESSKFQLKRSGRLMRKIEGAPPLKYRNFETVETSVISTSLKQTNLLFSEVLYISKPILHLLALYKAGSSRAWKPYMLALTLDIFCITTFYRYRHHLINEQYLEMRRRILRFLLYLFRSPFYERYTNIILQILLYTLGKVRFLKFITKAIQDYLQYFHQVYFYLWSV